jgi:hypothetical protein
VNMKIEELLLADPATGGINITCNQGVLRSVGILCYHNRITTSRTILFIGLEGCKVR